MRDVYRRTLELLFGMTVVSILLRLGLLNGLPSSEREGLYGFLYKRRKSKNRQFLAEQLWEEDPKRWQLTYWHQWRV